MNNNTIKSVSKFLEKIEMVIDGLPTSTGEGNQESSILPKIFYRGQSRDYGESNLQAGLFRSKKDEFDLTHTYMNMYDNFFRTMSNNGERLAQMQHYGLRTRLLNVTTLPLVALYFAVVDNDTCHDGLVFILYRIKPFSGVGNNQKYISYKTANSDHLEVVSTVALMDTNKQTKFEEELKHYNSEFKNLLEKYNKEEVLDKIPLIDLCDHLKGLFGYGKETDKEYINRKKNELNLNVQNGVYVKQQDIASTIELADEFLKSVAALNKEINSSSVMRALYHAIRQDNGDFTENIDFEEIQIPFFLEPPINNSRINAQHGHFLFEPFSKESNIEKIQKLQENFDIKNNTIKIDKDCKKQILDELDFKFGINKHSLFPDYSNGASYVNAED